MNILPLIVAALVMGASILGFNHAVKNASPEKTAPKVQLQQPVVENEGDIVRKLVGDFGKRLQLVSLSAPPEMACQSIQENYSAFVSSALLDKWLRDPQKALGRTVSSP